MTSTKTAQVTRTSELPAMSLRTVWWFMAITFGLGWGIGALLFLFTDQIETLFGPVSGTNPMFILLVWSPAIAGLTLVWRHYGRKGVGSFLRRLTLWRMPSPWWVFLLLGIPAVKYIGAAFNGTVGDFPFSPWYGLLPAMTIALFIGPIEELGWRGVALPLLQRRFAPLWSALILGAFWAMWHAPSFLLSGTPQSAWSIAPYLLGVLALSVIITPLFNAAQGSILIAALFHFQINGPAWPDAQPWENYLFAIVAIVVVIVNRKAMLSRDSAVTEVLMSNTGADVTEPRRKRMPRMRTDVQPTIATSPPPRTHDRSSRSWFWPGIGVAAAGLVAGLVIGITSYQDSQQQIDTFARLSVPGTVTVQVDEPGQQVVYYEGGERVGVDDLVVTIIDPVGSTVAIAPYDGELIYETTDLTLGRAIATFDAAQIGDYEIEVSGIDTGQVTVGESYARLALPGVLAGLAIAGLSLIAGLALWVFSMLRR